MDNEQRLKRADNASRMLKDPMWQEAWQLLTDRITAATMTAKTDEGTIRGKLMHGIAIDLRLIFEGYVKEGEYLRNNIKLDKEQKNWWKRAA
jgi:hypothetical protein